MPYLLGLFHWGASRVSKLGAIPKIKTCKIDRIVWEMHACEGFCALLFAAECTHGYPLPIHCTEVSDSFGQTLYSNSPLLVLNWTSLNIYSALLALNRRYDNLQGSLGVRGGPTTGLMAGKGDVCLGLVTLVLDLANSRRIVCGSSGSKRTPWKMQIWEK